MRVTKQQIVNGIVSYIESEVLPQVDDRSVKILASIAIKSIQSNSKMQDMIFANLVVKTLLIEDESGTYEIDELFRVVSESIDQYGSFPVEIPPIPLISPSQKTLSFNGQDIAEMKRRIERSN